QAFVVGFVPRARSSIHRSDADNSQLELDFPIAIQSGDLYDLTDLTKKLKGNEAFFLAIELALKEDEIETNHTDELTSELKKAFDAIAQTAAPIIEPQLKITTEKLWS